jgi:hypothetical protein
MAMNVPYDTIAREIKVGAVVPFVGSAASFAGLDPSPDRLPDGFGLAKELIKEFRDYPGRDEDPLTKVAQFYEECGLGRSPVYQHLRARLYDRQTNAPISPAARFLADLTPDPLYIISTNYDSQIERAFEKRHRPYLLLTHNTSPTSEHYRDLIIQRPHKSAEITHLKPSDFLLQDLHKKEAVIYKLHGTFANELTELEDTLILTEEDYVKFMVANSSQAAPPPALNKVFQERHFLFLGYSLADWNFRVILRSIHERAKEAGKDYRHWAIQHPVEPIEERFWQGRGVNLYDVDLAEFVENLSQKLHERGVQTWSM